MARSMSRLCLLEALSLIDCGTAVWCVSRDGWEVLTNRSREVYDLFNKGWRLYADVAAYEMQHGENTSGVIDRGAVYAGSPTGLDVLMDWIAGAQSKKDRSSRLAYGKAWVRGQGRLGVLTEETVQKVLDFLQSFSENTPIR